MAEVGGVQVSGEDLRLRVALLESQCERDVARLAPGRAVVTAEIDVLSELLGDRATALRQRPVAQVVGNRAQQPEHVDAIVLVEALVLGDDYGLLEQRRDRGRRDRGAADRGQMRSNTLAEVRD